MTAGPSTTVRLFAWAVFALACLAVVFSKLELSYDLSYFLPEAHGPDEQLLRDRAGDSPGSRLLFGIVTAPSAAQAEELAADLSSRLQGATPFARVLAVSQDSGLNDIPAFVWKYRYLLDDRVLTEDSLRAEIAARWGDVLMWSSPALVQVVKADPTMASLRVMEQFSAGGEMQTSFPMGDRFGSLVVAETRSAAFDLGGQRQALTELQEAFKALKALDEPSAELEIFGMGVYGLGVQEAIRKEATFRSIIATLLVLAVLMAAFRKLSWVGAAGLPVALGLLAGLAAIALVFGKVHGITIAFGITVMGITVDYPVHLMGHARKTGFERAVRTVMPAIGIGAASTAIAYLGLALTGSSGLAQLAVFSLAGIVVAAISTQWLLPMLPLAEVEARATAELDEVGNVAPPRLSYVPAALAIIASGLILLPGDDSLWSDDLSALTPIPAQTLRRDHELRQATGAPDPRYVIIAEGETRQAALSLAEELAEKLRDARERGIVERWISPHVLLPSSGTQHRRIKALPSGETLAGWLNEAVRGTQFSAEAFRPFVTDIEATKDLELSEAIVLDSPFAGIYESLLYKARGEWNALITLHGPVDFSGLVEWSSQAAFSGNIYVVDLKAASESLVARYRAKVAMVIGLAAVAILMLLMATERRLSRALWIVVTALAGLGLTVATVYALAGPLSVFHFVALLVVAGLGLDYGLFSSRTSTAAEHKDTQRSVLVCVASTSATFGVLAFSSIPVLSAIGTTITTGCLLCWGLSRTGATTGSIGRPT